MEIMFESNYFVVDKPQYLNGNLIALHSQLQKLNLIRLDPMYSKIVCVMLKGLFVLVRKIK